MADRRAGSVNLADFGRSGFPLLLTHGMAAHTHWWDEVAPLLRGFHAVALDFRGHGDSDWTSDGVYDSGTWTMDIEEARKALGWERFLLVGHSMGARIALDYAEKSPGRLRGLIAVDFLPEFYHTGGRRHERTRTRPQPVYDDPGPMIERYRLQPPGTLLPPERLAELGRLSLRAAGGRWTWKFDWRAFTFPYGPVWPQLTRISVPTLLVRGEHSAVVSSEELSRMACALPDGRALEIAGAYHHVPLDRPAELAAAVLDFGAGLPE